MALQQRQGRPLFPRACLCPPRCPVAFLCPLAGGPHCCTSRCFPLCCPALRSSRGHSAQQPKRRLAAPRHRREGKAYTVQRGRQHRNRERVGTEDHNSDDSARRGSTRDRAREERQALRPIRFCCACRASCLCPASCCRAASCCCVVFATVPRGGRQATVAASTEGEEADDSPVQTGTQRRSKGQTSEIKQHE